MMPEVSFGAFIVAASMIGLELGQLDEATAAALVAAGLRSVLLFPIAALALLGGERSPLPDPRSAIPELVSSAI